MCRIIWRARRDLGDRRLRKKERSKKFNIVVIDMVRTAQHISRVCVPSYVKCGRQRGAEKADI